MKKSLFLLLVVVSFLAFGQSEDSNKNFQIKEVTAMAVFPGCEEFSSPELKSEAFSCISKKLNKELENKLSDFYYVLKDFNVDNAKTIVNFVIDKNGKIILTKIADTDNYLNMLLGEAAKEAFEKIANEVPPIQPAKLSTGEKVNLVFVVPVAYKAELKNPRPHSDFNYTEFIVFSLESDDTLYEIRKVVKTGKFKVYEISENNDVFLGSFDSLNEIMKLEPYKSLFLSSEGRHLVTEFNDGVKLYRIYFRDENLDEFYLYKVGKGKEKLEKEYTRTEFLWSKYAVWLLR